MGLCAHSNALEMYVLMKKHHYDVMLHCFGWHDGHTVYGCPLTGKPCRQCIIWCSHDCVISYYYCLYLCDYSLGGLVCSRDLILALSSVSASLWRLITCECLSPRHWAPAAVNSEVIRPCRTKYSAFTYDYFNNMSVPTCLLYRLQNDQCFHRIQRLLWLLWIVGIKGFILFFVDGDIFKTI